MEGQTTVAPSTPADNTQISQDAGETKGAQVPSQPKAPAATPETFEMKVNGKVMKVTRDEAIRLAQLGYSASERFETAAQKEKRAEQIVSSAKSNPMKALIDLGLSKEQIKESMEAWYTQEFIEPETLTEAERKAKANERRLAEYEAKEKEAEERRKAEEDAQLTDKARVDLQQQIIDAIDTHKLTKDAFTVSRIAFFLRASMLKGYEAPIDLIVQKVKEERNALAKGITSGASFEQILEVFGEEVINTIRKEDLKRLKERRFGGGTDAAKVERQEPRDPAKRLSMAEVDKKLRAMRLGK